MRCFILESTRARKLAREKVFVLCTYANDESEILSKNAHTLSPSMHSACPSCTHYTLVGKPSKNGREQLIQRLRWVARKSQSAREKKKEPPLAQTYQGLPRAARPDPLLDSTTLYFCV